MDYWRQAPRSRARHHELAYPDEILTGAPDTRMLRLLGERWQQTLRCPVEVLVLDRGHRGSSPLLRYRFSGVGLPRASVLQGPDDLLVCSPELCFLQLATELGPEELIHVGFELCGTYAPPRAGTSRLVERPSALTSVEQLAFFLTQVPKARGLAAARGALRHIINGSASPMESVAAMLFCLPRRLGGLGLPRPELNRVVEFDREARKMAGGRGRAVCDMFWPGVAVEYEGQAYHGGEVSLRADRARSNALAHMGVRTISIYDEHIRSVERCRDMGTEIARAIGFRMQPRSFDETSRQLHLRRSILRAAAGTAEPLWPGAGEGIPSLASILESA